MLCTNNFNGDIKNRFNNPLRGVLGTNESLEEYGTNENSMFQTYDNNTYKNQHTTIQNNNCSTLEGLSEIIQEPYIESGSGTDINSTHWDLLKPKIESKIVLPIIQDSTETVEMENLNGLLDWNIMEYNNQPFNVDFAFQDDVSPTVLRDKNCQESSTISLQQSMGSFDLNSVHPHSSGNYFLTKPALLPSPSYTSKDINVVVAKGPSSKTRKTKSTKTKKTSTKSTTVKRSSSWNQQAPSILVPHTQEQCYITNMPTSPSSLLLNNMSDDSSSSSSRSSSLSVSSSTSGSSGSRSSSLSVSSSTSGSSSGSTSRKRKNTTTYTDNPNLSDKEKELQKKENKRLRANRKCHRERTQRNALRSLFRTLGDLLELDSNQRNMATVLDETLKLVRNMNGKSIVKEQQEQQEQQARIKKEVAK